MRTDTTTRLRLAACAVLCAALCVAPAAGAQMAELGTLAHTTPEARADFLTQAMTKELTLTPEQVPQVQTLNLQYAKLQQPLLESTGGMLTRGRKIKSLNSQKETSLRPLLTDAQWTAYEAGRGDLKQQLETWAAAQPGNAKQP